MVRYLLLSFLVGYWTKRHYSLTGAFQFWFVYRIRVGYGCLRAKRKYDSILLVLNVVAVILDVLEVGVQALVSVSCST